MPWSAKLNDITLGSGLATIVIDYEHTDTRTHQTTHVIGSPGNDAIKFYARQNVQNLEDLDSYVTAQTPNIGQVIDISVTLTAEGQWFEKNTRLAQAEKAQARGISDPADIIDGTQNAAALREELKKTLTPEIMADPRFG